MNEKELCEYLKENLHLKISKEDEEDGLTIRFEIRLKEEVLTYKDLFIGCSLH